MKKIYNLILVVLGLIVLFVVEIFDRGLLFKHNIVSYNFSHFVILFALSVIVLNVYLKYDHEVMNRRLRGEETNKYLKFMLNGVFKFNLLLLLLLVMVAPFINDILSNRLYLIHNVYPYKGNQAEYLLSRSLQGDPIIMFDPESKTSSSKQVENNLDVLLDEIGHGSLAYNNNFFEPVFFSDLGLCSMRDEYIFSYYMKSNEKDKSKYVTACLDIDGDNIVINKQDIPNDREAEFEYGYHINNSIMLYNMDKSGKSRRLEYAVMNVMDESITHLLTKEDYHLYRPVTWHGHIMFFYYSMDEEKTYISVFNMIDNKLIRKELDFYWLDFDSDNEVFNDENQEYTYKPFDIDMFIEHHYLLDNTFRFTINYEDRLFIINVKYDERIKYIDVDFEANTTN